MRNMRKWTIGILVAVVLGLASGPAQSQTITGTISGTVIDASAAVVPGANVTLTAEERAETRRGETNAAGIFVFPSLQPGKYRIKVEKPGFRAHERTGLVVTANQHLALGSIELAVGATTETVTVSAQAETVATGSSEQTGVLTRRQVELAAVRGRDIMNILKLMPGVSQITMHPGAGEFAESHPLFGNQALGAMAGTMMPTMQGQRWEMNTTSLDGQVGTHPAWIGMFTSVVSIETIAEVKVVLTNPTAEYGHMGGAQINLVTKSGTQDFHGSAYWFKRHEKLNANDFSNNKYGIAKPRYRFATYGFTLGGPAYIPKKFNTNKDKLFFFYAQEHWKILIPSPILSWTLPTALERQGDFSQTLDTGGNLVPIKDPLTGAQFPGNVIPADRINPSAQALLGVFPLPNRLDRTVTKGVYNYQLQDISEMPKLGQLLKFDLLPTTNDRFAIRLQRYWTDTRSFTSASGWGPSGVPIMKHHYKGTSLMGQVNWTRTFSPTLVSELNVGFAGQREIRNALTANAFDPVLRTNVGFTLGQWYPEVNPFGFIPDATFGGIPSAPQLLHDSRVPWEDGTQRLQLTENLSWSRGSHTFKFGIYHETADYGKAPIVNGGRFDFGRDVNNPGDTGWSFSNALLGNFRSYSESTKLTFPRGRQRVFEWFVQDNWKASRKLTLDIGVRFSWFTPWQFRARGPKAVGAGLVLDRYDPANAPVFYGPALDATGKRVAQDPTTGQLYPAVYIGAFVPSTGDPVNGIALWSDTTYPDGFRDNSSLQMGPRFGFAYDPTGSGKTAIRGAFGVTKQTMSNSDIFVLQPAYNPPIVFTPIAYYGSMDTLLSSAGVLRPGAVISMERNNLAPTVYSWNFGIQRQLMPNTVLDVAYVGNTARHLLQGRNLNALPYGTRFDPANIDPTTGRALPDDFLRPYPGYANINYYENSGISNYNALQASLNRRFTGGVQFALAYTWSKALGLTSSDGGFLPLYVSRKIWLYGPLNFDQAHMLSLNYMWDLPKASVHWQNFFSRAVLDNWHLWGVTTFATGQPQAVTYTTTDAADITGGGDGDRPNVIAPVQLPFGERTFDNWFNRDAFARPAVGDRGNAPQFVFRKPGINNWDLTLAKSIPLKSEQRYLEFRWELYNAFNHTQGQFVNSAARFNPAGQQTNALFGTVTGTRLPRVMQFGLRLVF